MSQNNVVLYGRKVVLLTTDIQMFQNIFSAVPFDILCYVNKTGLDLFSCETSHRWTLLKYKIWNDYKLNVRNWNVDSVLYRVSNATGGLKLYD